MHVHVISYDVPYPPTTGGMMDVYYCLKAMTAWGTQIHLHAFSDGRMPHPELYRYCVEVNLYSRRNLPKALPGRSPKTVAAHNQQELLDRLLMDDMPLIFMGIESTYFLSHPEFERRVKMVRLQRIDWEYHYQRAQHATGYWKQQFHKGESRNLQQFEQTLGYADFLIPISPKDGDYYREKHEAVFQLPPFHPFERVSSKVGKGEYCLYHANLAAPENEEVALFLIDQVFHELSIPLIIAGANPTAALIAASSEYDHIVLRPNPGEGEMTDLLHHAHVHVLPAFHSSGLPMKLITSLYTGRFVVVNPAMVHRTGLEFGTHVAQTPEDMQRMIFDLSHQSFTEIDLAQRKAALNGLYSNELNARTLIDLIRKGKG